MYERNNYSGFKNLAEFNKFCDESMFCVCGNLMTGLHMSNCRRLGKIRVSLIEKGKKLLPQEDK